METCFIYEKKVDQNEEKPKCINMSPQKIFKLQSINVQLLTWYVMDMS